MASRTQLRLTQLTGSVDDTKAAAAAISETSIQGVLDHLAASIKRIHGGSVFQNQTAGAFSQTIDVTGAITGSQGLYVGGDADIQSELKIGGNLIAASTGIDIGTGGTPISTVYADQVNATGLTGSLIDTTISQNQIVFANGDSQLVGSSDLTWNGTTLTLASNKNLIVGGDLTVNGTQTVLDTTSLVIEDSVIALSSGSAANADVNAAVIFQRATANLGADSDKTNGALMFLQGTGFKLGYTSDTAETAQGSLAVADDDLGELYVGQLSVGGASDNIAISGGALAATSAGDFKVDAATDIILDADGADIFFDDGGTRFGGISMNAGGNTLILSSSAGNSITLSSQTSQILLMDSTFSGLTLDIATANQLQFLDRDDRLRLNFESAGGNDQVLVSGSLKLDNGADPAQLVFKEASPNGTNTLTLDVPAAIGSSYTLTLPASNGTSGQVLKLADGNGNLEFGSAVGDLARSAYKVTAQITPADLDFSSSGNVSLLSAAGYTALNITKSAADLPKALEVFVNGQLLVSGSDGGGDTDYTHKGSTTLKFAFNLEADDIVQIIQR